jgi:hypothetical protein
VLLEQTKGLENPVRVVDKGLASRRRVAAGHDLEMFWRQISLAIAQSRTPPPNPTYDARVVSEKAEMSKTEQKPFGSSFTLANKLLSNRRRPSIHRCA